MTTIFREIISASRDLQKPMNIAFLGPEASFSHQAARLHFGKSSRFWPQPGIARVFDEVEKGAMEWGVVPVENSLEGSVNVTLDRLILTPLKIQAEMYLRISQCLISSAKSMKGIKNVYSIRTGWRSVRPGLTPICLMPCWAKWKARRRPYRWCGEKNGRGHRQCAGRIHLRLEYAGGRH